MRTPLAVALDLDLAAVETELAAARAHHRAIPVGAAGTPQRRRFRESGRRVYGLLKRRDALRARRAATPST